MIDKKHKLEQLLNKFDGKPPNSSGQDLRARTSNKQGVELRGIFWRTGGEDTWLGSDYDNAIMRVGGWIDLSNVFEGENND